MHKNETSACSIRLLGISSIGTKLNDPLRRQHFPICISSFSNTTYDRQVHPAPVWWIPSSQGGSSPILEIIVLLLLSIALPYFALASNSPLTQAWFSRIHPARSYARLYALSNLGSLLGLLTYPFLIEPNFSLQVQGWIWSAGFLLFGLLTTWIAVKSGQSAAVTKPEVFSVTPGDRPSTSLRSLWIALSATASLFLLSVTNQITQDVAVIPFLWVLPLSIYLLSFILTFSGERGYNRRFFAVLFIVLAALTLYVMLNATRLHVYWQILVYCLLLFASCMLCHGELYRLRPTAEHLTEFYLMVSFGGALGGIFVSLIAPLIFNGYWEFLVGLAMTTAVLLTILRPLMRGDSAIEGPGNLSARARFVLNIFLLVTILLSVLGTFFFGLVVCQTEFLWCGPGTRDDPGWPNRPGLRSFSGDHHPWVAVHR